MYSVTVFPQLAEAVLLFMPNLNSDSERVDIEMRNVLEDISIFSYLGRIKFFLIKRILVYF